MHRHAASLRRGRRKFPSCDLQLDGARLSLREGPGGHLVGRASARRSRLRICLVLETQLAGCVSTSRTRVALPARLRTVVLDKTFLTDYSSLHGNEFAFSATGRYYSASNQRVGNLESRNFSGSDNVASEVGKGRFRGEAGQTPSTLFVGLGILSHSVWRPR